jgi:hypothetical protein
VRAGFLALWRPKLMTCVASNPPRGRQLNQGGIEDDFKIARPPTPERCHEGAGFGEAHRRIGWAGTIGGSWSRGFWPAACK